MAASAARERCQCPPAQVRWDIAALVTTSVSAVSQAVADTPPGGWTAAFAGSRTPRITRASGLAWRRPSPCSELASGYSGPCSACFDPGIQDLPPGHSASALAFAYAVGRHL